MMQTGVISKAPEHYSLGPILFVATEGKIEVGKESLQLTRKENSLIAYLVENLDRTVTKKELLTEVWGYSKMTVTHTVETHIYRLRQKIKKLSDHDLIVCKERSGYTLSGVNSVQ